MLLLIAAANFAFTASAGTRGERRADAVARAESDEVSLTLGAADFGGPQAPQRQEVLLGARYGHLQAEARAVPSLRASLDLGLHFETVSLVLDARAGSLGRTSLRAAGARIELESEHAGASAAVWALQLDGPARRDPWTAWGNATLDWAERWEVSGWVSRDFFDSFSLAPSLSLSQPAAAGFEARCSLSLEVPAGPVKLSLSGGAARMWPQELWLMDLTMGVSMTLE